MLNLPDTNDHPIQLIFGYYDDWIRPDCVQLVIALTNQYEEWELETILAAEAVYASNFLCPN